VSRNPEYFTNQLSVQTIVATTISLLNSAGDKLAQLDHKWITERAEKGWCAAEIARACVRTNFDKSNPLRRRFLTALTKLGAPEV
jgi:hypothetical protein